jgi:hypothetical protein
VIQRADACLLDDPDVRSLLQKAQSHFANVVSSEDNTDFHAGLELASQHPGVRGHALCVAASANFPEAENAALLVVEMAQDLARAARLDEEAERRSRQAFFEVSFTTVFLRQNE